MSDKLFIFDTTLRDGEHGGGPGKPGAECDQDNVVSLAESAGTARTAFLYPLRKWISHTHKAIYRAF